MVLRNQKNKIRNKEKKMDCQVMSSLFYDSESWRINEKPSRFLPINVKNNMDRACDKCESSKKNKNYKEHFANN